MSQPYVAPRQIGSKHFDSLVTECLVVAPNGVETITTDASGNLSSASGLKSTSASAGVGYATGAGSAVTQQTNSSTGVTINTPTGQITTVALTTAAAAEERFTVSNSSVAATDVIAVSTTYGGANTGTPAVSVMAVGSQTFDIVITNLHATNPLNAALVINFAVIKGVAA